MMGSTPPKPDSFPLLSHGISGLVRIVDDNTVLKHPAADGHYERDHIIERRIYERLGQHPRIVKLISFEDGYIVLERLKYPLRQHLHNLQATNTLPSLDQIFKWSQQVAEGIQYLHSKNVFQADIGTHNLLLDSEYDLKVCDFAGSSIDGEPAWVCPSSHAEYPFTDQENYQPTVKSELFSLGSVIYEICTTRRPYDEKSDSEVEKLYRERRFPETGSLLLGSVVLKCWFSRYSSAAEVFADLEEIQALVSEERRLARACDSHAKEEREGESLGVSQSLIGCVSFAPLLMGRSLTIYTVVLHFLLSLF